MDILNIGISHGCSRALRGLGISSALASLIAGCAADTGSRPVVENEQALNLVAELQAETGAVVRFYEPEPGHIVVLETGPADQVPVVDAELARLPAVHKYERLSGRPAPIALVEAAARAEQLALTDAAPGEGEPLVNDAYPPKSASVLAAGAASTRQVARTAQELTSSEFIARYCRQANFSLTHFWVNATGTTSFTWTQLDYLTTAAYAVRGSIRFSARWRPRAQWSGWTSVTVPSGQYASWFEDYRPNLGFGWNSYVDQADGDLYHFCSYGND